MSHELGVMLGAGDVNLKDLAAGTLRSAALVVAGRANGRDDCRELLDALGLLEVVACTTT